MAISRSATPTNTAPVPIAARSPSAARTPSASNPDTTSVAGDGSQSTCGQAPRPVERRPGRERHRGGGHGVQLAVALEQEQVGADGTGHGGHRRRPHRHRRRPLGDRRQPPGPQHLALGAGRLDQQRHPDGRRSRPAARAARPDPPPRAAAPGRPDPRPSPPCSSGTVIPTTPMSASAVHRGRDHPSGDAHASRRSRGRALASRRRPAAGRGTRAAARRRRTARPSRAQARGSPSTRSATTLRWISLVPA